MSYLGTVDLNDADIKHYSLTGSTLTTVNIGWVPVSEQSLRVTINGVVQQGDTFSYSGANLTLGGPLVTTDTLEVVGIQSVGGIITPADDSVTTDKLADDSVTTAKILDDNVTLAKMASGTDGNLITYDASGDPAYVLTGAATEVLTSNGTGAAPTFQAVSAGGITQVQQWRVSADFTISTTDLDVYQNWEKPASGEFPGSIGSDMAVDSTTSATLSGAWTFPETGTWLVRWCMFTEGSGGSASLYAHIAVTDDNGASWVTGARNDSYGFHNQDNAVSVEYIVNIADTATDKVKFHGWSAAFSVIIRGHTDYNAHYATFMRLGDAS